jgi:hypothetical protein
MGNISRHFLSTTLLQLKGAGSRLKSHDLLLLHNQAYSVTPTVGRDSVINDFVIFHNEPKGIKVTVLSAYCLIFMKV